MDENPFSSGGINSPGLGQGALTAASLINPAVGIGASIGGQLLSNALDPNVKLNRQQQQFQQQLQLYGLKRQNLNRGAVLPGMYANLGYSPEEAASMTKAYTSVPLPGATVNNGKAKQIANGWVQSMQNPFDAAMSGIDKQTQAGELTPEEAAAQRASKAKEYLTNLQNFSTQGGHEGTVAAQALDTFRKYYGDPAQFGVDLGYLGAMPGQR